MTILESILSFTGTSVISGITWDILKDKGGDMINLFKKQFTSNKSFDSESECEEFLRFIAKNISNSKKNPYRDVESGYEDIVENPNQNFIENFKGWITENMEEFKQIKGKNEQCVSVYIQHQENNGDGIIINAGIINN